MLHCKRAVRADYRMSLFWLVFNEEGDIAVVIIPASALVYARLDAAKKELDEGTFVEAHQLDDKLLERIPKAMIGRRLNQDEAKRLLAKLG
jgi:hypothetical protein